MIPVSRFFTAQDPSNDFLSYTQKGIDFFEKLGQFSKEKAAIEEEYSAKLKNIAKKYAKKSDEDDDLLKNVSYINSFNSYLQHLDQIAGKHHDSAESIREDVVTYVSSKTCQLRSSRKYAITDLKTINETLEEQINEMCKSGKCYSKAFREAENANQKFYRADKNLELSRLDLEKTRAYANTRNEICEKAKADYSRSVVSANSGYQKYHDELLPVIFTRLKTVDKECISDVSHVLQKLITVDDFCAELTANCRSVMQKLVDKVDPEADAQRVLETIRSTIERSPPFEIEDLGDPKKSDSRANDSTDGKPRTEIALTSYHILKSPGKRRNIRNLLGIKEKETETSKNRSTESPKESYADKDRPPQVRLSCLRSKIREMEKQLEQAVQGREGITRLQKAYYANPQHGNPSACTEPLVSYAKKIETLKTSIQNLKEFYTLLEISLEGASTERSFGGRDTPDTTRSCSTNQSSSKTLEDGMSEIVISSEDDLAKNMLRQLLSSPKRLISSPRTPKSSRSVISTTPIRRKTDISSPVLRSSFSGAIRKTSVPVGSALSSPHRSMSSPIRIDKSATESLVTVTALFDFQKTSAETMTIVPGDELFVQEADNGDGWTRARKKKGQEVGFVPTSYLQFTAPSSPVTPP